MLAKSSLAKQYYTIYDAAFSNPETTVSEYINASPKHTSQPSAAPEKR